MSVILLILCSMFITFLAKNKTIEGNARTIGLIIAGILCVGSMFL